MKSSHETIFVGREEELQALLDYAREALAGKAGVALITGEAGMGKTSLVQELFRRLRAEYENIVIAAGQCTIDSASYLPFRTMLEQLAESGAKLDSAGEVAAGKKAKVRDLVLSIIGDVGTDIMEIFLPSTIARVAGKGGKTIFGGWLGKAPKDLSGIAAPKDLERVQIYGWYTRVMKNIAQKFPLVLFIDDLHWADDSSLNLLLHLGLEIQADPIFVIGTYRPHEAQPGSLLLDVKTKLGRYGAKEFPLDLAEDNPAEMAKATRFVHDYLLAQYNTNFADHFEQLLVKRTEGNALFLAEILKDMEEQGQIIPSQEKTSPPAPSPKERGKDSPPLRGGDGGGVWQLTASVTQIAERLPERVENAISARVNRLEKELREILDYASVQGDDFIAQVIAKVKTIDEGALIDVLTDKLMTIYQLIRENGDKSLPNGVCVDEFAFKHNLIREYVYAQLPKAKKRRIHAQIGECLEQLYAPQADEIAAALAGHFYHAHIPEKTVIYGLHAAQDANARYGASEAVHFAKMGLEALETRKNVLPPNEYTEQKVRLLLELAKAEENGGDPQEQKDHVQAGINYLEENLPFLNGLSNKLSAEVYLQLGKLSKRKMSHVEHVIGYLEKALNIYEQYGDKKNIGETLYLLGDFYQWKPLTSPVENLTPNIKGLEMIRKSLTIAESLDDIQLQIRCLSNLTWKRVNTEFGYAEKCALKALELSKSLGNKHKYERVFALRTMAKICRAKQPSAIKTGIRFLQEALELAIQSGDIQSEMDILSNLGSDYCAYLDLQKESFEVIERSLSIRKRIGSQIGDAFNPLGTFFKNQGNWKKAADCFSQLIQETKGTTQAFYKRRLAEVYIACEKYEEAEKECLEQLEILNTYHEPLNWYYCAYIVRIYLLLDDKIKSKEWLGKFENFYEIAGRPSSSIVLELYQLLGRLEIARFVCQEIIESCLKAEDAEKLVSLAILRLLMGKILVDMGDFQEAIPYLEKAQTAFAICQHYALGETLFYLGKAHLGLGGVVFQRQAKDYVTKAFVEFQRLELRHKAQEAQNVLQSLTI